jgi:hypothetical protein
MKKIKSFAAWFTAKRRKAVYALAATITPLLVTAGVLTGSQEIQALSLVSLVLTVLAGILSILNLTPDAAE